MLAEFYESLYLIRSDEANLINTILVLNATACIECNAGGPAGSAGSHSESEVFRKLKFSLNFFTALEL